MTQPNLAPAEIMLQMISGFWVSRIVYAAAKLGIADCLQDRPKTVAELATLTNTHAPSLYRLLRALASVGIFEEIEKQQFAITPLAQTLQTGVPGSLRYMAIEDGILLLCSVGLSDRIQLIAGDFFESVPVGGDAYLMKWIIHDWDEEKCATILKNCHRSMPDGGKLLLVESVVEEGNSPSFTKLLDVNMLVMTGGRERTAEEYRILLELSGFKLTRLISTPSPFNIIEAEKSSTAHR